MTLFPSEPFPEQSDEFDDDESPSLGSRIFTCIVALAVGLVFGMIATVSHQLSWPVLGMSIPMGLILSLIGATALLVGFRLVLGERLGALFAAIGIVGTVALFSLQSVGGSVLIPSGVPGMVFTFGIPLVAAIVLSWPKLPQRVAAAETPTAPTPQA